MGNIVAAGGPPGRVEQLATAARRFGGALVTDLDYYDWAGVPPAGAVVFAGGPDAAAAFARVRYLGCPVAVVAAGRDGPWADSGTAVLPPDATDADILRAATAYPAGRPVPPDRTGLWVDPVVAAVTVTLQELCQAAVELRGVCLTPVRRALGDVSAVLRLKGDPDGVLVVNCPAATADAVAARMLAEAGGPADPEMVRDCVGEVANVVAGQVKTILSETPVRFRLSTPEPTAAGAPVPAGGDGLLAAFDGDLGPLGVQLVLPGSPHARG